MHYMLVRCMHDHEPQPDSTCVHKFLHMELLVSDGNATGVKMATTEE